MHGRLTMVAGRLIAVLLALVTLAVGSVLAVVGGTELAAWSAVGILVGLIPVVTGRGARG